MKGAIDREHLAMAREVAEAFADSYLESFLAEGLLPDGSDLEEIKTEIERIISHHRGNDFWSPSPSTADSLHWMPQQVYLRFATKVRHLRLENAVKGPTQPSAQISNQINIGGNNYGALQQGGQGNIQKSDPDNKHETE